MDFINIGEIAEIKVTGLKKRNDYNFRVSKFMYPGVTRDEGIYSQKGRLVAVGELSEIGCYFDPTCKIVYEYPSINVILKSGVENKKWFVALDQAHAWAFNFRTVNKLEDILIRFD